jgi:hypothetical protein
MTKKEKKLHAVWVDESTKKNIQKICKTEYYTTGVAVKVAVNGYLIAKDYKK